MQISIQPIALPFDQQQLRKQPPSQNRQSERYWEVWLFALIVAVVNLPLWYGSRFDSLIFYPQATIQGEWWRLLSHPFVHLSAYHLILDAGAFLLLYKGLEERLILIRLLYVSVCGAMSLFFGLWFSPIVDARGLCGLSGIAHGLMAISALEMMETHSRFRTGLISFLIVVPKSAYELFSGDVLFSFLHMGMCGTPVGACHAGGVVGGILIYGVRRFFGRKMIGGSGC